MTLDPLNNNMRGASHIAPGVERYTSHARGLSWAYTFNYGDYAIGLRLTLSEDREVPGRSRRSPTRGVTVE